MAIVSPILGILGITGGVSVLFLILSQSLEHMGIIVGITTLIIGVGLVLGTVSLRKSQAKRIAILGIALNSVASIVFAVLLIVLAVKISLLILDSLNILL